MAGQTQLSARLGSDNAIFKHDIPAKVKRSSFPYGRKRDFCIDPGMIVPIDLWETLPGDYFEVKLDYLLKSFPLKVPPFTTYKVRTHWYYCKKVDLWAGALTYMVKGRSHSISLSNPKIDVHAANYVDSYSGKSWYTDTPMSLASFFGFQPGHYAKSSNGDYCSPEANSFDYDAVSGVNSFYGGTNVLPQFMYQKIYRFAYIKPNLLQDNKVWFPDDMSDGWRIHYSKDNVFSQSDVEGSGSQNGIYFVPNGSLPNALHSSLIPSVYNTAINMCFLRYAMFEDDRFTTSLPWSTRGTPPKVSVDSNVTVDISQMSLTIPSMSVSSVGDDSSVIDVGLVNLGDFEASQIIAASSSGALSNIRTNNAYTGEGKLSVNPADISVTGSTPVTSISASGSVPGIATSLGFDINDLRAKIALTVWQERNATTQGYYNEMVYAHFNENPDSQDYEPRYLGGTSDIISFSEVIQHDNADNDTTPQGHSAGLGENRSSSHVFSYRCKDYGYIMGVMIIQPETVYNSKIEKLWLREVQEDEYFPEYQGIGLQEILKGEIFPTGTSSDKDLFGYQERDTEYKTRDNQAIGFFALPHTVDRLMSAYSQCREFVSQPSLSQQFVTMSPDNIRKDCLAVPSMPFFRCSLVTTIHAVRPLAYSLHPNTFGY